LKGATVKIAEKAGSNFIPKLRHHKATGQAYVVLNGKAFYMGHYGTEEASQNYHRTISEWLSSGKQASTNGTQITVSELVARFWTYNQDYYRHSDGTISGEVANFRYALRPVIELYGDTKAIDFGPRCLRTVRSHMIKNNLSRSYINQSIARVKMMFKWAVGEELIPGSVYHALSAVSGMRKGRCEARETEAVKPVPQGHVNAIEPYVSNQIWAIIQMQLLTAARPTEILTMRPCDIDRGGKIWIYSPAAHKTAHHGHNRQIYIGPRGQEILRPYLIRPTDAYCFSPAEAEAERRVRLSMARRTSLRYGNVPGSNCTDEPARNPGHVYDVSGYRRAIRRAIENAFIAPEHLQRKSDETKQQWQKRLSTKEKTELKAWYKQYHWHPHQLRHNAATFLRKEFGLETARIILGHRSAAITEVYAELDQQKAMEAIVKVG